MGNTICYKLKFCYVYYYINWIEILEVLERGNDRISLILIYLFYEDWAIYQSCIIDYYQVIRFIAGKYKYTDSVSEML